MFDDSASDALDSEMSELELNRLVKLLERLYFLEDELNAAVSVAEPADGPACSYRGQETILINPHVARFTAKLCRILILHELIHMKLWKRDRDEDEAKGERFQAEVKRLWEKGAYSKLL